jgi:ferritin-like metal-binding protein YciE
MKFPSLDELFLHELKDLYDAEHQLTEALPKMAEAANDPELKEAFESHLQETTAQVARLEEVFAECGETPEREDCAGMKGLIKEGEKLMKAEAEPSVTDAALIASAQRVERVGRGSRLLLRHRAAGAVARGREGGGQEALRDRHHRRQRGSG